MYKVEINVESVDFIDSGNFGAIFKGVIGDGKIVALKI